MRAMSGIFALVLSLCVNLSAVAQGTSSSQNAGSAPIDAAGKIDLIEGDVHVLDLRNLPRTVKAGDNVFEGDSIATGANGEIHLTMIDDGFIAVRSNTKMRITQYRAQGDDQDKGVIALLTGSLRSITGWIGKYRPKAYTIRTPTATIGIRGTDHEPMVIPEGATEGEPGTYDKVNAGGTTLNTAHGSVDVSENHAAFAPHGGKGGGAAPRMLATVPSFYRGSRNERLIEGKHEAIQKMVESHRAARQQQIREMRANPANRAQGNRLNRKEGGLRHNENAPRGNLRRNENVERGNRHPAGMREGQRKMEARPVALHRPNALHPAAGRAGRVKREQKPRE